MHGLHAPGWSDGAALRAAWHATSAACMQPVQPACNQPSLACNQPSYNPSQACNPPAWRATSPACRQPSLSCNQPCHATNPVMQPALSCNRMQPATHDACCVLTHSKTLTCMHTCIKAHPASHWWTVWLGGGARADTIRQRARRSTPATCCTQHSHHSNEGEAPNMHDVQRLLHVALSIHITAMHNT